MADEALRNETIVGSSEFVARHAARARERRGGQRVPQRQARVDRPSLEVWLDVGDDVATTRRRAVRAVVEFGYPMTAVAARLGCHYTTISRWVSRERCDDS